jgi:hypothetical protein
MNSTGIVYSRANQTTSYTTAALWTQSFGSTLTGIAFHISGVVGRMLYMNTTDANLYWNGTALVYNSGTWGISITGNAATVGGYSVSGTVGANTVVIRDVNNYVYFNYINSNVSETENATINSFYTSNGDGWLRKSSVAHVKSQLGLGSLAYSSATIPTNNNQLTNGAGYITGISSGNVTTALGYTPWNYGGVDASRNIGVSTNLDTDLESGGAYGSYGAGGTSWNAPFSYGAVLAFAFTSGIKAQFGFDIRHGSSDYGDLRYRTKNNVGYSTWRTMWHSGNLTNLNQLSNGPGYITSYTETDTLATVTARGASTTSTIIINGGAVHPLAISSSQRYQLQVRNINNSINSGYGWWWFMDTNFNMGFHADGAADRFTLTRDGNLSVSGTLSGSNLSGTNTGDQTNISGNAATATTATYVASPDGGRNAATTSLPNTNSRTVRFDFATSGTIGGNGNYGGVMTYTPWDGTSASTGDSSYQLAFLNETGVNASGVPGLSIRNGINSAWNGTWYRIITSGNIGSQSVSNATTAGGLAVHTGRNNEADKIVRTDASGYIQAGWINTLSGDNGTSAITRIYASDDGYIRYYTPANFISNLGLITSSNIGSQSVSSASTVTGSSTIGGYLTLNVNWGVSPYTAAFNIVGTHPSMVFRGSNGDTHYMIHMDSAGDMQYYFGPGYTTNNWTQRYTFTKGGNFTALTGTISATNFSGTHSGTSSGTNTGDQTNISGSAGSAGSAGYAGYLSTAYAGGQQTNPQVYFNNGVGLKAAMTGAWSVWSDTLWINGYAGGDVLQMCALHTLRNGTPRMAISVQASTATSYGTFYEFITTYNIADQTVSKLNPLSGDSNYKLAYTADGARTNAGEWGRAVMYYVPNGQTYGIRVDRADLANNSTTTSQTTFSTLASNGIFYAYNGVQMFRNGQANTGISWYNSSYYNWQEYMASAGATGCGPNGNLTAPGGLYQVSSWALRSRMETVGSYGWLWEVGGGGGGVAAGSAVMELDVYGNLRTAADVIAYASDGRLKTNVKVIENAISKVQAIRGVEYDWLENIYEDYGFKPTKMHEVGVIAQEVELVLPEVVLTAPFNGAYKDKHGIDPNFLTVKYDKMVPLLIEAIKEQQTQIESQKSEIDVLKDLVQQLINR